MQTTFFYLGRILKKLADDQCSSITKGSIYHIKPTYIQPFTTVVDWPEIGCLMEVSTMFHICRYCIFTWGGRYELTRCFEGVFLPHTPCFQHKYPKPGSTQTVQVLRDYQWSLARCQMIFILHLFTFENECICNGTYSPCFSSWNTFAFEAWSFKDK